MGHNHQHHGHGHGSDVQDEKLLGRAFLLIAGFMLVEVIGGVMANSLTLLADAGHMFLDATALGFSWYSLRLSRRSGDHNLSYGYHRYQVLASLFNGVTLLGLVAWILVEAFGRLLSPEGMLPIPALIVATAGFLVNILAYRWLHRAQDTATVRSAALHVLGDLLGSAAAIIAALTVYLTGWLYADPLLAVVIAAILGRGAWGVFKQSAHILLEGVPDGIDLKEIKSTLTARVAGVQEVHHVHAWALTAEKPMVTLHATVEEDSDLGNVMERLKTVLQEDFGIDHSTIQVEHGPCPDD